MTMIGHVFIPLNRGHDGLLPSSNDRTHFESLPVPLELWEPFEQSLSEHLSDLTEGQIDREEKTERHRFIPGASCSVAYADKADAIGQGQTISQPLIVALMTHFAEVKFDDTVLEIGTGSGYQAAILARLVRKVCTVEIIPPLAEAAEKVLRELGYD